MKLMIVDDEKIIRDGLAHGFDWPVHGHEVVGCAADGIEGARLILKLVPDIIICDIKMPHCDGLEMLRRLGSRELDSKIILMTGFEEFEYAKAAVDLRVDRFLLKPIDDGELLESVNTLSRQLAEERTKSRQIEQNHDLMRQALSLASGIPVGAGTNPHERQLLEGSRLNNAEMLFGAWRELRAEQQKYSLDRVRVAALHALQSVLWQEEALNAPDGEQLQQFYLKTGELILSAGTADEIFAIGKEYLELVLGVKESRKLPQSAIIIRRAEEYIAEHYQHSSLSLRQAAEGVFVSPSYLGALFRRTKQIGFNDYLTTLRIEKAKELLRNTSLKSADIAAAVGYSNPQYFALAFKKQTGFSPIQYKNK